MKYNDQAKTLLDELLSPIPVFVRPMARKPIEKSIEAEATRNGHDVADEEDVLRGYIIAGMKRDGDKDKLIGFLKSKGIDTDKYAELFA
ncbi:MAG TPA: DUF2621 family protein [Bacilli bacterium]|nr:DUF2621 family protein [Bacilli bacterium]